MSSSSKENTKFLSRVPLAQALTHLLEITPRLPSETTSTEDSCGRVTAHAIVASYNAPHYRASAMDGIAVRSAQTLQASPENPLRLRLGTNQDGSDAQEIDTGGLLPEWADSVVRIEEVRRIEDNGQAFAELRSPVLPGTDVRRAGEDLDAGQRVVARGHRLTPWDLGGLLASGVLEVRVTRRPRLTIVATGSEVIEPTTDPAPGKVIEYNGRMLAAAAIGWGAEVHHAGIVADNHDSIAEAVRRAVASSDIVAVIAGSSVGRKDLTVDVLRDLGEVLVHGVDMMPGKPVSIARVENRAVVGVPGYPVSAIVAYEQLLKPFIFHLQGLPSPAAQKIRARVGRKIPSKLGVEEFRRVCLCRMDDQDWVAPLGRGAGAVSTVLQADGWLRIKATHEGVDAGAEVQIELLRPLPSTAKAILAGADEPKPLLAAEDQIREHGGDFEIVNLGQAEHDRIESLAAREAHFAVLDLSNAATEAWLNKRLPHHQRVSAAGLGAQTLVWAYPEARAILQPLLDALDVSDGGAAAGI